LIDYEVLFVSVSLVSCQDYDRPPEKYYELHSHYRGQSGSAGEVDV